MIKTTEKPGLEFIAFQVKVQLEGKASRIDNTSSSGKGSTNTEKVVYQGASFWGSSHTWSIYMPEDLSITNVRVTDDRRYLYISYDVQGSINFHQNNNGTFDNTYDIYLQTKNNTTSGYSGGVWNTEVKADYRISNNRLCR